MAAAEKTVDRGSKHDSARELELVRAARAGDKEAVAELFSLYNSFIRSKARSYYIAGSEPDDIIQEGMIGFFKAIRDYREDKNTSFESFAKLCVARQIMTAVKAAARLKHLPLNSYVSINKDEEGGSGSEIGVMSDRDTDPQDIVLEREESALLEKEIESVLSPLEKKVLADYLTGKPYEEIAKELGITTKSVDNAVQRIKKKFGRFLP